MPPNLSSGVEEPVSVLLPTVEASDSVLDVRDQMTDGDELIVVCDLREDRAFDAFAEESGVNVVVAGEPDGCSGKANAIAAGMAEASNDILVWTDDDFRHGEDWLDRLKDDFDDHGNSSDLPFFVGSNAISLLLEPVYSFVMVASYLNNQPWGGSMIFDRTTLDQKEFVRDLKNTIGDDVLIAEYIDFTTTTRTHRVKLEGSNRSQFERIVRFVKNVRFHEPGKTVIVTAMLTVLPLVAALFTTYFAVVSLLAAALSYLFLGYRRASFILTPVSVPVGAILFLYALSRKRFEWGGRTYKQSSKFDVEVARSRA